MPTSAKIRAAVEDLGKQIATPAEAHTMLALRGAGPVSQRKEPNNHA
jgi:hypothetical protein